MPPRDSSGKGKGARKRPTPRPTYSGKFGLRTPTELHQALAEEAQRQHTSMNTLAIALIASGLRWRQPDDPKGA